MPRFSCFSGGVCVRRGLEGPGQAHTKTDAPAPARKKNDDVVRYALPHPVVMLAFFKRERESLRWFCLGLLLTCRSFAFGDAERRKARAAALTLCACVLLSGTRRILS